MRFRTVMAIVLTCAPIGFAQEHMADTLRSGILEEDSKQQPGAAIQQYQAVMTQFAETRQTAATALFRMAECYRKLGSRTQAIAAYQRLLKDFPDQSKLAAQSRTLLATTYNVTPAGSTAGGDQSDRAKFQALMEQQTKEQAKTAEARARYRATIEEEMELVVKQLSLVKERQRAGSVGAAASDDLEEKLIRLKRELAAFDAGMTPPRAP
jgi:hypothetical protein